MKAMNIYREYLAQEERDNAILATMRAQAEAEAFETALQYGIETARASGDWDLYSDLYKDLYGRRPRSW